MYRPTSIFFLILTFSLILIGPLVQGQNPSSSGTIPKWIVDNWKLRTQKGGNWIADNSPYKTGTESADEYGIRWVYGIEEQYVVGTLYALRDGKHIADLSQIIEYWDIAKQEVNVLQISRDGTIGRGKLWEEPDGKIIEQQTFVRPGGEVNEQGHYSWFSTGEQHNESYNIKNGVWKKKRSYTWILRPAK